VEVKVKWVKKKWMVSMGRGIIKEGIIRKLKK
jgi:hypothetical protein